MLTFIYDYFILSNYLAYVRENHVKVDCCKYLLVRSFQSSVETIDSHNNCQQEMSQIV